MNERDLGRGLGLALGLVLFACLASCRAREAEGPPEPAPASSPEPRPLPQLPPELFGAWIHVREEDRGEVRVYRPRGHPLPPSRGRDGLELFPDGRARLLTPGPNDAGAAEEGRWELLADRTLRIVGPEGIERLRLTLVDVGGERLEVLLHQH